jgi:hypothetical protein
VITSFKSTPEPSRSPLPETVTYKYRRVSRRALLMDRLNDNILVYATSNDQLEQSSNSIRGRLTTLDTVHEDEKEAVHPDKLEEDLIILQ